MNTKIVLDFLKQLKQHNDREWFEKNREKYVVARAEYESFINELIPLIKTFDKAIGAITAKECLFRIYRDVRFSNDKSPYKPNFGAFIGRGGRKSSYGGYYVHFEHNGCFLAGGVWMPAPEILKAVRQEIYYNPQEFKKIINNKNFKQSFPEIEGEKLTRPPKDFPADFPDADLLKYKSYIVSHELSVKILSSDKLTDYVFKVLKLMYPLNKFINRAIDLIEK
jgi:uncharacterized protein (TIGR02453 family)